MNCPRDGTRMMAVRINGCRLKKCKTCQGLWLAHDDLQSILKLGRSEVESAMRVVADEEAESSTHAAGYMRCPSCVEGRLQTIDFTFTKPVKIDRCDRCFGYWLDRSELDAIVAEEGRLAALDREAIAAEHQEPK